MKLSFEGLVIYLSSIAFFLAFKVELSPYRGSSHNSMAFCFKSFTLSESFKERSRSIGTKDKNFSFIT